MTIPRRAYGCAAPADGGRTRERRDCHLRSNKLLTAVVILQGLILVGQWTGQPAVRPANADVTLPDPAARQVAMVEELRGVNAKLDKLIGVLQSGDVQVKVAKDDEKEEGARAMRSSERRGGLTRQRGSPAPRAARRSVS